MSFEGRDLIRKFGKISRINLKTASIVCEDGHEWRVSFALLQRVMKVRCSGLEKADVLPQYADPVVATIYPGVSELLKR